MGSSRYSAGGAEAFLDKLVGDGGAEVQTEGAGAEGAEDEGRVDQPLRGAPKQEPVIPPAPEVEEEPRESEAQEDAQPKPKASKKPSEDETEVELKRRGQTIRVPLSRAVELAQKGWDYDSKMQELKAHEDALRKDAKGWENYQTYREWMRKNTPAAQAVANLLQYFEEKGRVPRMDLEGEGEPGTESPPSWMSSFMDKIDSRFAALEGRERERMQDQLARDMIHAVRSQPVLKRMSEACLAAGKPDRALQKLAAAMKADPDADLMEVAELVATDLSQDVETLNPAARTYVDEKVRDQKRFGRAERPGAVAPTGPAAEQKTYSAKDLKDGTVRRGVKAFLDSIADE